MATSPSGVVVVDKPEGPTSHDVVDAVRRVFHTRRVGHAGTLDPFATGVLPVLVGKGTRLARFLSGGDKHYRARVRFGFATSTDDLTGEPLFPPRGVDLGGLREACESLTGSLQQVLPLYSARRVGGRRLYDLARSGVQVTPPSSAVTVHSLQILEASGEEAEIEVRCSAGTYVRSLARDLGERLGCGAHLRSLRRTESGGFPIDEAWPLAGLSRDALLPLSSLRLGLPEVRVGEDAEPLLRHGGNLPPSLLLGVEPGCSRLRVVSSSGRLLAIAVRQRGEDGQDVLHPELVLVE